MTAPKSELKCFCQSPKTAGVVEVVSGREKCVQPVGGDHHVGHHLLVPVNLTATICRCAGRADGHCHQTPPLHQDAVAQSPLLHELPCFMQGDKRHRRSGQFNSLAMTDVQAVHDIDSNSKLKKEFLKLLHQLERKRLAFQRCVTEQLSCLCQHWIGKWPATT